MVRVSGGARLAQVPGRASEGAQPVSEGPVTVESRFPVSETIDRLAAGAAQTGLLVFGRIDHAKGARDAGLDLRPTQLLIFGHPAGDALSLTTMCLTQPADGRTAIICPGPKSSRGRPRPSGERRPIP
jgi:hypothetical protein